MYAHILRNLRVLDHCNQDSGVSKTVLLLFQAAQPVRCFFVYSFIHMYSQCNTHSSISCVVTSTNLGAVLVAMERVNW